MLSQKDYWDQKIKEWSEASYEKKTNRPIERLANLFRRGVTGRMEVALKFIGPQARGKVILDMGCGRGDFCFGLLNYQPQKVIGMDISGVAIKEAKKRAKEKDLRKEIEFIQGDLTQVGKLPEFDIVVGLGFIDYFNEKELQRLFKLLAGRLFFFSMFEKKLSLLNLLHAVYVRIQNCPGAYKYTREEMGQIIPKETKFYFLEKDKMLFITNLSKC